MPPFPFDNTYAKLPDLFFQRLNPSPVKSPQLIRLNRELAEELGLDADRLESPEGLGYFSGNTVPEGADPIALAYSGHQFGGFSPQLGDGRALLLGEIVGKDGVRRDIQLKGSGPTPFSRRGDGRSALGPVIREYIVSEAMVALGVPTTRALAAVATGEKVYRESMLPGGVFTRVARSHIRIGTFQFFAARDDWENVRILANHAIARHYSEAAEAKNPTLAFLAGVIERQAKLIARWMQLGFIHGVMNTDNMSISGETIDYGPCAFLDRYHPDKVFSSIDRHGRYAYGNQGAIGQWNLFRFAETLIPLIGDERDAAIAAAEEELNRFGDLHGEALKKGFLEKIGIENGSNDDWALVQELLSAMEEGSADFTLTFRHLSGAMEDDEERIVESLFQRPDRIRSWIKSWQGRMQREDRESAVALMKRTNPIFIPRNHRVEEVIAAAYEGDYEPFDRLNAVLRHPFREQPESAEYERAPEPSEMVHATFCGT